MPTPSPTSWSPAGMMARRGALRLGLPSVLIPLPTAAEDHQRYNAEALAKAGASRMILQRDLTPEVLGAAIRELLGDRAWLAAMHQVALGRGKLGAADEIVSYLLTLLGSSGTFASSGTISD
ncbi:MAG: glycosyltransferase [Gemmatimonadales bacterium]